MTMSQQGYCCKLAFFIIGKARWQRGEDKEEDLAHEKPYEVLTYLGCVLK
jgi:hypothetical protein